MDGVAAMKAILCQDGRARVIVMTTFDGEEDIYNALRAGAKAYLLKKASREEVIDCIRAVHAGQKRIPPEVALKLADRMSQDALTEREGEICASDDGKEQCRNRRGIVYRGNDRTLSSDQSFCQARRRRPYPGCDDRLAPGSGPTGVTAFSITSTIF